MAITKLAGWSEAEVDRYIASKHAAGTMPASIASAMGRPVVFVRGRLEAMGYDPEDGERDLRVHTMWAAATPLEDRRYMIWKRAQQGARDTRMIQMANDLSSIGGAA